jgi:hypothetical protein
MQNETRGAHLYYFPKITQKNHVKQYDVVVKYNTIKLVRLTIDMN